MTQQPTLDVMVLIATQSALVTVAPHLSAQIKSLLNQKPLPMRYGRGAQATPKYVITVSKDDATAILAVLKQVQKQRGFNAVFDGKQVILLISEWNRVLRMIQL